ncbi:response regulator [Halovenus rubra]|uniref:Response regulator n=2 Tax=Halovenus rubra TaxID=869890 RepID=A0ABD5X6B5_9EURY
MSDSHQPSVLLVEDEERVARTYELRLGSEYDVTTALGGTEALALVDDSFDVVLLDRRMPDVSGDEVLAEIRRRSLDCRVVMVTAVDPDFDITEMNFDGYVVKPVGKEDLREAIERALTISEYNDQIQKLSSLKLRRNVLEVEMADHELQDHHRYQDLNKKIEALEEEVEEVEKTIDLNEVDLHL